MASYLIISTSGNPDSNSRRMGRIAFRHLEKSKVDCGWLDISELDLPLCDADVCYTKPGSRKVSKAIKELSARNSESEVNSNRSVSLGRQGRLDYVNFGTHVPRI